MKDTLIKAERISLDVPLYRPKEQKIKEGISALIGSFYGNGTKRKKKSILSDVSFELKSGQNLGILGRNGSGKTTLLRVICGVYQHTSGSLELNGEPYGLFNVQLGMNSQATGVENIYLRGFRWGYLLRR